MSDSLFPETPWSLIAAQVGGDEDEKASALRRLLSIYWPPVFCAIRDGWEVPVERAELLCHDFLAAVLHDAGGLVQAHAGGRLRDALRDALDDYMQRSAEQPANRDSGIAIKCDHAALDVAGAPSEVYDAQWTLLVFEQALQATESSLQGDSATALAVFKAVDVNGDSQEMPGDSALTEARRVFRRELLRLVCDYVSDDEAARVELAWLLDERSVARANTGGPDS